MLFKIIIYKTFRLKELLEALEPLRFSKLLGSLKALELKIYNVF